MENSVSNVFHIDKNKLSELQSQSFQARGKEFKYIKCPSCRTIMNRRAFGYKSGVIVDHCNKHGYWLDEGELRQLQEWKKAGGELRQKSSGRDTNGQSHQEYKPGKPSGSLSSLNQTFPNRRDHFDTSTNILDLFTSFLD